MFEKVKDGEQYSSSEEDTDEVIATLTDELYSDKENPPKKIYF